MINQTASEYMAMWSGFIYLAFTINVYACFIAGWSVSSELKIPLALDALEQTLWSRKSTNGLNHHSDSGYQDLSTHYTERLREAGILNTT